MLILQTVFQAVGHGFDSRIPRQNSKRGEPLSNPKEVGRTERIAETVRLLSVADIVPSYTTFDITEEMLAEYIRVYGSLGPKGNGKFQYRYARKLAGLEQERCSYSQKENDKDDEQQIAHRMLDFFFQLIQFIYCRLLCVYLCFLLHFFLQSR